MAVAFMDNSKNFTEGGAAQPDLVHLLYASLGARKESLDLRLLALAGCAVE